MLKIIAIKSIKRNPKNPRYVFEKQALQELAETIKVQGVIHPVEIDENNMIICGERRWRASQIAGLKEIPCTIKKGLSNFQKLQRQYIENAQHRDLNIVEKGRAFTSMMKFKKEDYLTARKENAPKNLSNYHAKGIKELAEELGETDWTVRNAMTLTNEAKVITDAIEKEDVAYTLILETNKVKDLKIREKLKQKVLNNDFATREALKMTIAIADKRPEELKSLYKKSGEALTNEIQKIIDNDRIANQDIKITQISMALPYLQEEFKKFTSNSLARFLDHLEQMVENAKQKK